MKSLEEIGKLKKGRYIILDDHPCKILSTQTSAPGKHGHAKVRMDAVSLKDGSKHSTVKPADSRVEVPMVEKRQAQILVVSSTSVQMMDTQSYETFELDLPKDMQLESGQKIFYWIVLGNKMLRRGD
ncbi:MAG: translation initiation factor IF-5A [Candidatus Altiarchaeota archaeon]|nr:translation initiation factor IF-5A [Candidatus Altiarchaeota archaeon]